MANCVLHHKTNFYNWDSEAIAARLATCIGLQVFADGGMQSGRGAIGVVCLVITETGSEIFGHYGLKVESPCSSFFTEICALETATDLLQCIGYALPPR